MGWSQGPAAPAAEDPTASYQEAAGRGGNEGQQTRPTSIEEQGEPWARDPELPPPAGQRRGAAGRCAGLSWVPARLCGRGLKKPPDRGIGVAARGHTPRPSAWSSWRPPQPPARSSRNSDGTSRLRTSTRRGCSPKTKSIKQSHQHGGGGQCCAGPPEAIPAQGLGVLQDSANPDPAPGDTLGHLLLPPPDPPCFPAMHQPTPSRRLLLGTTKPGRLACCSHGTDRSTPAQPRLPTQVLGEEPRLGENT